MLEWIVVDGESSDGTVELLHDFSLKYEAKFETQILSRAPNGIYDAMNFGASIAKGEYLLFLNAGDFFLQSKSMSIILEILKDSDDAACIALPVAHLTRDGYLYDMTIPKITNTHYQIHHQGAFLSNAIFKQIGGYDVSLKWAADGKLLDTFAKFHRVLFGKPLTIAFEIGGASAQHYRELLREISIFRPNSISPVKIFYLSAKNKIKLVIYNLDRKKNIKQISLYYYKRQLRILNRLRESNEVTYDWSKLPKDSTFFPSFPS
jgi:glycosyltransferase involved in cell wall biosynthesis